MTLSSAPKNAFPLPTPLTFKLVALGLGGNTAEALSDVYISAALNLKAVCETEYARACNAIMVTSEAHGHSSKELRSKLLTVAVARYMQALSECLNESIEKAKVSLLRRDAKRASWPKVSL